MGRDSGGVGSSRYITVKTGQGWLEVAQSAAGNSTADQVAAYAVKLAKQNKNKKPRPGMVVQNPVYQGPIGMTPAPSPYFGGMQAPSQVAAVPQFQMPRVQGPQPMFSGVIGQMPAQRSWFDQINRPSMNLPGRMPGISLPAAPGPYQVQAPSWAANYQQGAEQRKTGMPATTPAPAPSWAKNYQTLAPWRNSWMPSLAPAMPAGFYPTPTMLPDTWAQSYPRTAQSIAAQIESGYFPSTISALDQYELQLPDEILSQAGYQKQSHGGWARMGPARLPSVSPTGRYAYGSYGGRGGRYGGGGGGSTPRPAGGGYGGYGGGYSTSGRMLESVGSGLISWRI
jgi:hypothetical protein